MKTLLVAATAAEIAPTVEWLHGQPASVRDGIEVLLTGVGLMAATFALTRALSGRRYDLVIGAGIAGAFETALELGECVVVQSEQLGDLGAEDHDEFLDVFRLGFLHKDEAPFVAGQLPNHLQELPFDIGHLKAVTGITVNTVSGSSATIAARAARYAAQVESMEGAALHYVCLQMGQPFLQLRAVSNYVTPRDRASWEIGEAVTALNAQLVHWFQQPAYGRLGRMP